MELSSTFLGLNQKKKRWNPFVLVKKNALPTGSSLIIRKKIHVPRWNWSNPSCKNSASFGFKRKGWIAWPSCSKLLLDMEAEPDLCTSGAEFLDFSYFLQDFGDGTWQSQHVTSHGDSPLRTATIVCDAPTSATGNCIATARKGTQNNTYVIAQIQIVI